MASSTRLTIPNPCSQPWQAMTPDQQGRFCAQCQKTVVDFTAMTDAQVLAHLQQTSGPGCGRFRSDQLNRTLVEPLHRRVNRWHWASLLLSGWLSSQAVQAQSGKEPNEVAVVHNLDDSTSVNTVADSAKKIATVTIKGRVISANERVPIPGASIFVLNTDYKTFTDSAGLFRMTIPTPTLDSVIRLSVSYIFYVTQQVPVQSIAVDNPVLVELQENTAGLNERFVVGLVIQKPTLWRRIRNWFRHG